MKNYERKGQNPFSLSFGRKPIQYISRIAQTERIITDFNQPVSANQVYMITGVRGSGKTVFMTNLAQSMEKEGWIVTELNPNTDLQRGLAAALYALPEMHVHFVNAKIDLSFFGMGASIEKAAPITDYDTALSQMMKVIQKEKKKLLVLIDEVSNTEQMRVFASSFQMLVRRELPIFLLMTGLYQNISDLQNEKNLTFLYRAPKVVLDPLSFVPICERYIGVLHVSREMATEMAKTVKGYPYGFQVLGYLFWERDADEIADVLPEFDQYMDEYVYSKIWEELSAKDKAVLFAMVNNQTTKVKEIREHLNMTSGDFSVYRDRLIKKGVISGSERGVIRLVLPRFDVFVNGKFEEEGEF